MGAGAHAVGLSFAAFQARSRERQDANQPTLARQVWLHPPPDIFQSFRYSEYLSQCTFMTIYRYISERAWKMTRRFLWASGPVPGVPVPRLSAAVCSLTPAVCSPRPWGGGGSGCSSWPRLLTRETGRAFSALSLPQLSRCRHLGLVLPLK